MKTNRLSILELKILIGLENIVPIYKNHKIDINYIDTIYNHKNKII